MGSCFAAEQLQPWTSKMLPNILDSLIFFGYENDTSSPAFCDIISIMEVVFDWRVRR